METEKRLRKDLKRTKVLLADAQIMLDHIKNNAPSKRETAQLKNQVHHPTIHDIAHLINIRSIRCFSDILSSSTINSPVKNVLHLLFRSRTGCYI